MTQTEGPWLARSDWASRRIKDAYVVLDLVLWVSAIAWNGVNFLMVTSASKADTPSFWFFAVFFVTGALLLAAAIYVTAPLIRYGRSVFELQTLPAVPGSALAGTIRIPRPFYFHGPIHMRLVCYRHIRAGKNSSDMPTWDELCTLDRLTQGEAVSQIPVYFQIPSDALVSNLYRGIGPSISWRLEVKAKTGGLHYIASFLVPVFHAPLSQQVRELPDATEPFRSSTPQRQPAGRYVLLTPLPGGCQYEFLARRNWGLATFCLVMGIFFLGCGAVLTQAMDAGPLFAGVFLLVGAVVIGISLRFFLRKVTLIFQHRTLTIRSNFLFMTKQKQLAAEEVRDITIKSQGAFGNKPIFGIRAVLSNGSTVAVCGAINSTSDADWLAEEFKKQLGLR